MVKKNTKKVKKLVKKKSPSKSVKNPKGAGRKPTYRKEYCDMVTSHMEKGFSFASFAGAIKVCRATVYSWTVKYPEFMEAKERGRERELYYWEQVYNRAALGNNTIKEKQPDGTVKVRELKPNAALIIFAMKNKFPTMWRDQQEEKDTDDNVKITYERRG